MADRVDAYKVLMVDPEAEHEVIQAAYRRLARKYHPDLAPGTEAGDRMAAINAAWALLGTPGARAAYDHSRAGFTDPGHGATPSRRAAPQAPRAGTAGTPGTPQASGGQGQTAGAGPWSGARSAAPPPPAETVSRDWTPGRSTMGGGFDGSMRRPEGLGAAGSPPGRPSGSVLSFGRYSGWSLGEIARHDLEYIEWLDRMPIGRTHRDEIDAILRGAGRRQSASADATKRRGLFRRR